jgi:hypothetical protein
MNLRQLSLFQTFGTIISRALRNYNDALAEECLATAKKAWVDEHNQPVQEERSGFMFFASA